MAEISHFLKTGTVDAMLFTSALMPTWRMIVKSPFAFRMLSVTGAVFATLCLTIASAPPVFA
ncbi:hypothetical protein G4G27_00975 [Sphingomonas sp. So64.6b]|uniref:hypothetical protein n=1 Tax=Sphingomonas sp. So64.6b TaxID=2997354 RepID=UPI001602C5BD|nr:hypothetical protein [Sphingomonas sp. So64.6b]QNA82738.1 hypothetical protein G4G27_00975 [Sphingomonas sp. So64.6b]